MVVLKQESVFQDGDAARGRESGCLEEEMGAGNGRERSVEEKNGDDQE